MPIPLTANATSGFTATGDNFTADETGTYLISYDVNPTTPIEMTTQVRVNGTPIGTLTSAPSNPSLDYSAQGFVTLAAGDTVGLYALGTGSTTLETANGAVMTLVKIA